MEVGLSPISYRRSSLRRPIGVYTGGMPRIF
jgi:hypothetical protein